VSFNFDSATGAGDLVVAEGDGWSLGFSVNGQVTGRTASVHGSKITYPDALPGADLSFQVGAGSLKELVVLERARRGRPTFTTAFPSRFRVFAPHPKAAGSPFTTRRTIWPCASRPG
jgi:hypothetical protein